MFLEQTKNKFIQIQVNKIRYWHGFKEKVFYKEIQNLL